MSNLYTLKHNPEWAEYYLYDLADWINGLAFRNINFSDNGLPVIKIAELKNGISAQTKYTDGIYDEKYRLLKGDILFSWSGSPETSIDVFWFEHEAGWLNQHIFKVVAKELVTKEYLYYLLKYAKPNFIDIAKNKQTTGLGHVTGADLKRIKVSVPSIEEQVRIVSSLKPIDDKIDLNRQINQNLERVAQAIFKSWFVDFDPVRAKIAAREAFIQQHPEVTLDAIRAAAGAEGDTPAHAAAKACELAAMCAISGKTEEQLNELDAETLQQLKTTASLFSDSLVDSELGEVPEGWVVKKIDDVVSRQPVGKKYSQKTAFEEGEVPILDQGKSGVIGYHNEEPGVRADPDNPIIVFANHTCYMRLVMHDFSAIQNVLPFKSEDLNIYWIYMATRGKQEFVEYKGHWPDFVIKTVVFPSRGLDQTYGACVADMFKGIYEHEKENNHLSLIRDDLLPKLLSGELQVDDVA
jgi:type I restriction enzyme S subunit